MKFFTKTFCVITFLLCYNPKIKANVTLDEIIYKDTFEFTEVINQDLENIKKLLEEYKTTKALEQLYIFIDEAKKNKQTTLFIEANLLLADVYRDNGNYKESNNCFNKILPLIVSDLEKLQLIYFKKGGNFQRDNLIDSAKVNYQKSILIGEKIPNKYDLKAKVHSNISGIYYLNEQYEKAIEHSIIAANYQGEIGNKDIEAGILNNLGTIYYMQGKNKKALETFEKAFELVGFGQNELQKKTRRSSFINIAYAYAGLNDYEKAFEYQDKYFSLSDSLQQELKYKEISEIESKYKVEANEKEVEIEKGKRKEVEYLTFGLGIALVMVSLVLYVLYKVFKLSKKNYNLQINQEQLLHQNKLEKVKSEAQFKILAASLDGRLEERKTIASVLHDNVSALLSAANLHLFVSISKLKDNVPDEIDKTQSILKEASLQIRNLSHKLISSVLLKFGLSVAVEDLCEKSSNSMINIATKSINVKRYNQDFEIKIFNIINELVNNMLKHSNASVGIIKIEQINKALQIIIEDNGQGFDFDEIKGGNGIGLSEVEARIKILEGILNISSTNKGSRFFMSIPIIN